VVCDYSDAARSTFNQAAEVFQSGHTG
jgi:hypothetical protein